MAFQAVFQKTPLQFIPSKAEALDIQPEITRSNIIHRTESTNMTHNARVGLLICQDLMFLSKVTGIAQSLGFQIEATSQTQGIIKAAVGGYACVILDLSLPLKVADLTSVLRDTPKPPVIAFGAHVDTARLEEARQAGCLEVLPRSAFNMHLPEILTKYLGEPEPLKPE
jgi:CheY-like chemotaxis protein